MRDCHVLHSFQEKSLRGTKQSPKVVNNRSYPGIASPEYRLAMTVAFEF